MKRVLSLVLIVVLCLAVFAGCKKSDDDWKYISDKGKLVIGITEYAPMNYYDTDGETLIGFDTEFANAVCAKLGITPEFVVIEWDTKETELASKKIDCIWNGLTVKEDRKANMDFSSSYLLNEQVVVIRSADASKFSDAASFKDVTVAAESGSAGADAVTTDLPDAKLVEVSAQSDALLEVKAGTADAAVIDVTMATSMTGEGTDYADLTILTSIDLMDEEYAIGFRKQSTAVAKFNTVIADLSIDGTLATIAAKYDLTDLLIVG